MYTIKEASSRSGVPVTSLRAWERRYGVVRPRRTESGYRLYDDAAIAALSAMRRLVDEGWSPATAAAAIASGEVAAGEVAAGEVAAGEVAARTRPTTQHVESAQVELPEGEPLIQEFLDAASCVDVASIESVLDRAFGLGSFETVTERWLMPALCQLGDAWARGDVDVAGEHAASYAVMRRLSQAFSAASSVTRGPRVVVGLPSGSHHELGALAFATAARRRGLAVVYVGADLPVASWRRAVRAFPTRAAVLAVPTSDDREKAAETARELLASAPGILVAAGGSHADDLAPDVFRLPSSISEAARIIEDQPA